MEEEQAPETVPVNEGQQPDLATEEVLEAKAAALDVADDRLGDDSAAPQAGEASPHNGAQQAEAGDPAADPAEPAENGHEPADAAEVSREDLRYTRPRCLAMSYQTLCTGEVSKSS